MVTSTEMTAKELIIDLTLASHKAGILAGFNGPYNDPETPVRNASHWLVTNARCYQWTGDGVFKDRLASLVRLIFEERHFPGRKVFYHRLKEGKDSSNGLIGPAWTYLGLWFANQVLDDAEIANTLIDVAEGYKFDERFGLWNIMDLEGQSISLDPTFNHQLWYASSLSFFAAENEALKSQIDTFLDRIDENLEIVNRGLIYHPIDRNLRDLNAGNPILKKLKPFRLHPTQLRREMLLNKSDQLLISKSQGYHFFNLFAFEVLRRNWEHQVLWSRKIDAAYKYGQTKLNATLLAGNKYSFGYNAPGFEVPFIYEERGDLEFIQRWLDEQISKTFNPQKEVFAKGTNDPVTLTARIFELAMAKEETLDALKVNIGA